MGTAPVPAVRENNLNIISDLAYTEKRGPPLTGGNRCPCRSSSTTGNPLDTRYILTMMFMPSEDPISRSPGVDGQTWIVGRQVRVLDVVVCYEHQGISLEEIVSRFPTLTPTHVKLALNYYFDHTEVIQQEMRTERQFEEEFSRTHSSLLEAKLRQRRLEAAS